MPIFQKHLSSTYNNNGLVKNTFDRLGNNLKFERSIKTIRSFSNCMAYQTVESNVPNSCTVGKHLYVRLSPMSNCFSTVCVCSCQKTLTIAY